MRPAAAAIAVAIPLNKPGIICRSPALSLSAICPAL